MLTFIKLPIPTRSNCMILLGLALSGVGAATWADDFRASGSTSTIFVSRPNGGQVLAPQSMYTIRWLAQGIDSVSIEYSPDGGGTWLPVTGAVSATGAKGFRCTDAILSKFIPDADTENMGSYEWLVPDMESTRILIRVLDKRHPSVCDVSDQPIVIARSASSGWTQESVGSSVGLVGVSIVDDQVAWTCGWDGVVFRTTSGGSSWTRGTNLPTDATSVWGVNADTAFVCANFTNDGRVYRTTNAGTSWSLVLQYIGSSASILNVHMFEERKGVAVGNPVAGLWRVFKTTDGGLTWDTLSRVPASGYGMRTSVAWGSEQQGWFGTDVSLVYRTLNGGLTWSSTDLGGLDVFCLAFPTMELGMITTAFRYVYKTTNGGSTWAYVGVAPAPHPATIISFLAGVAVPTPRWWEASLDEIYRSTDHGATWTFEALANGYPFNDISMKYIQQKGVIVGYAVAAADGVVMKYQETVVSAPEQPTSLPSSLGLSQNYPNPFNPSTEIEFQMADYGRVSLKVFDVLGREVATLVNEVMGAGTHRVKFNAAGLSSGVYVCRIESSGCMASRKMVLLK